MTCYNQVLRAGLSDAKGVFGIDVSPKVEAGRYGLWLNAGSTQVMGMCTDYSGNIYLSDTQQHCIFKISEGGKISRFAGLPGTGSNNNVADGPVTKVTCANARFLYPKGICCDKSNNLYVADYGNHQIRKIDNGGYVSTVAGDCTAGASGLVDGVGHVARFYYPMGIAIDNSGNLFVADWGNEAVRKIFPNGKVVTIAGNGSSGDLENIGPAVDMSLSPSRRACLSGPWGISVDAAGTVYVVDGGNKKIKKITTNGWLYLHSGNGSAGFSRGSAGHTAATASSYTCNYNGLTFSAMDRSNNLYVIDTCEGRARVLLINQDGAPQEIIDFKDMNEANCPFSIAVSPGQKLFVGMNTYIDDVYPSSSSSSESSSSSSSSNRP